MRIAITEDSAVALEAVRRVVAGEPRHAVAWVARDGEAAVRQAAADRPDLLLMDLVMPGTNGAEATRRIMAASPCPILVVTSTVSGNFCLVYEALGAGAVDAVATPTLAADGTLRGGAALLAKIDQVGRKVRGSGEFPALGPRVPLVALGASTGGPQALAAVLAGLPPDFPAAVVVAQHMDADFTAGLAGWLGHKIRLPVRLAEPDDAPQAGTVLIAGRNDHLVLTAAGLLAYTPNPAGTPFRPNIDVLFASLAAFARPGVAAVLTGMGRDGAAGLLMLRRAGWATVAQEPDSCVLPGMPAAAVGLGAAAQVLAPAAIGEMLAAYARRGCRP